MEVTLHCNVLKCRALVPDRAVTTTCCHIFCLPCAERLGLTAPRDGQRTCPACHAVLANPDDAVVAQLAPSEDYKTSVLAGLSPTIIMEITGRGLAFWNYQMAQEITYQDYLAKCLTDRYHDLHAHMETSLKGADAEVKAVNLKLQDAIGQLNQMHEKHEKLVNAYKEKAKSQQQIQRLYQALKQQQLAAGMEFAAGQDADHVLLDQPDNRHLQMQPPLPRGRVGSISGEYGDRRARLSSVDRWPGVVEGGRLGTRDTHGVSGPTRLPQAVRPPGMAGFGVNVAPNEGLRRGTPLRGTFATVDPPMSVAGSTYPVSGDRGGRHMHEQFAGRTKVAVGRPGVPGFHGR